MLLISEEHGSIKVKRADTRDICTAVHMLLYLIPPGHVTSYSSLAKTMGIHPRLVAICLKNNKDLVLIPCHRVVHSDGRIGGYSGPGPEFKEKLLRLEGVVFNEDGRISGKCFIDLFSAIYENT